MVVWIYEIFCEKNTLYLKKHMILSPQSTTTIWEFLWAEDTQSFIYDFYHEVYGSDDTPALGAIINRISSDNEMFGSFLTYMRDKQILMRTTFTGESWSVKISYWTVTRTNICSSFSWYIRYFGSLWTRSQWYFAVRADSRDRV